MNFKSSLCHSHPDFQKKQDREAISANQQSDTTKFLMIIVDLLLQHLLKLRVVIHNWADNIQLSGYYHHQSTGH